MPKGHPKNGINKGWFKKGSVVWNKGKKGVQKVSQETRLKLSKIHKGYHFSSEAKEKIRLGNLGKKRSKESKLKMSLARRGRFRGKDSPSWKGGTSYFQFLIRGTWKYREWRDFVYQRDEYKCRFCLETQNLNAHHFKSFAVLLKENNIKTVEAAFNCDQLWDLNNGITLCKKCHYKLHSKLT